MDPQRPPPPQQPTSFAAAAASKPVARPAPQQQHQLSGQKWDSPQKPRHVDGGNRRHYNSYRGGGGGGGDNDALPPLQPLVAPATYAHSVYYTPQFPQSAAFAARRRYSIPFMLRVNVESPLLKSTQYASPLDDGWRAVNARSHTSHYRLPRTRRQQQQLQQSDFDYSPAAQRKQHQQQQQPKHHGGGKYDDEATPEWFDAPANDDANDDETFGASGSLEAFGDAVENEVDAMFSKQTFDMEQFKREMRQRELGGGDASAQAPQAPAAAAPFDMEQFKAEMRQREQLQLQQQQDRDSPSSIDQMIESEEGFGAGGATGGERRSRFGGRFFALDTEVDEQRSSGAVPPPPAQQQAQQQPFVDPAIAQMGPVQVSPTESNASAPRIQFAANLPTSVLRKMSTTGGATSAPKPASDAPSSTTTAGGNAKPIIIRPAKTSTPLRNPNQLREERLPMAPDADGRDVFLGAILPPDMQPPPAPAVQQRTQPPRQQHQPQQPLPKPQTVPPPGLMVRSPQQQMMTQPPPHQAPPQLSPNAPPPPPFGLPPFPPGATSGMPTPDGSGMPMPPPPPPPVLAAMFVASGQPIPQELMMFLPRDSEGKVILPPLPPIPFPPPGSGGMSSNGMPPMPPPQMLMAAAAAAAQQQQQPPPPSQPMHSVSNRSSPVFHDATSRPGSASGDRPADLSRWFGNMNVSQAQAPPQQQQQPPPPQQRVLTLEELERGFRSPRQ